MLKVGFEARSVNLIMMCVNSVTYSILHNGIKLGPITPCRGLRQVDPLSPYLFILCPKGLSSTIQSMQERGHVHGCKIAKGAPTISHLFFVDVSYPFFKASLEKCVRIKQCLHTYERALGKW